MEWSEEEVRELATDRGGVIQGYSPIYSSLQLYLVQVVVIVFLCFVLGQLVKRWNQPRVIAEVGAKRERGHSILRDKVEVASSIVHPLFRWYKPVL